MPICMPIMKVLTRGDADSSFDSALQFLHPAHLRLPPESLYL